MGGPAQLGADQQQKYLDSKAVQAQHNGCTGMSMLDSACGSAHVGPVLLLLLLLLLGQPCSCAAETLPPFVQLF